MLGGSWLEGYKNWKGKPLKPPPSRCFETFAEKNTSSFGLGPETTYMIFFADELVGFPYASSKASAIPSFLTDPGSECACKNRKFWSVTW